MEAAYETDRVRALSTTPVNREIDTESRESLAAAWPPERIALRLAELDGEWDFERVLETEAAVTGLAGLALGVARDARWLLVPGVVAAMLWLHAIAGPYPMLPLFRRLGVRTRDEIDRERHALKALRGDFEPVRRRVDRAEAAWRPFNCEEKMEPGTRSRSRPHTAGGQRAHRPPRGGHRPRPRGPRRSRDRGAHRPSLARVGHGVLQTNAAIAALAGMGPGVARDRRWLALPEVVFSFFLQHAVQGWCPPVSVFRRLGIRTRREINAEKYALKALRGDFDEVAPGPRADR